VPFEEQAEMKQLTAQAEQSRASRVVEPELVG
jgi:hypothetical protein